MPDRGFLVPTAVRFAVLLRGLLVLAFVEIGVVSDLGFLIGNVFWVPSGVLGLAGIAFAGFGAAGADEDVLVMLSFLGARFTGVAVSVELVIGVAVFWIGVAVLVRFVVLDAGATVFFAVGVVPPATLEVFPALALKIFELTFSFYKLLNDLL